MASRYKIGLTYGGITSLDLLATPLPNPQAEFRTYKRKVRLGNGRLKGLGPQTVVWEFPMIDVDEQAALYAFFVDAPMYIQTPNKDEEDTVYEVTVDIPDPRESGSHRPSFNGYRTGFTMEFTILSIAGD